MTTSAELSDLNRRLGILVALVLRGLPRRQDGISLREQIQLLEDLGVRPKEIAEILGRTPTYVSKELAGLRKGKGSTKRK